MQATKQRPPMPALEAGEYLLDELFVLGACSAGPMGGFIAATWVEVDAFARCSTGISTDWEAELLVKMSREYVKGLQQGLEPLGIAPFDGGKLAPVVSSNLKAVLGG